MTETETAGILQIVDIIAQNYDIVEKLQNSYKYEMKKRKMINAKGSSKIWVEHENGKQKYFYEFLK